LATLTATSTSGNVKTYKIPLKAFTSLTGATANFSALTTLAGFWNPTTSPAGAISGALKVQEVYYTTANDLALNSVVAATASPTVGVGSTVNVVPSAVYENGAKVTLATSALSGWTSSNTAKATVSPLGAITGVALGTTTVTATYGGKTLTVNVTVGLSNLYVYSDTTKSNTVSLVTPGAFAGSGASYFGVSTDVTSMDGGTNVIALVVDNAANNGGYSGGGWSWSSGVDVHSYSSLVLNLNKSAITALRDMQIDLASDSTHGSVVYLKNYTGVANGTWTTYTIPMSDFQVGTQDAFYGHNIAASLTSVTALQFEKLNNVANAMIGGTLYLDNIYFKP
jgi:hypothetical protein